MSIWVKGKIITWNDEKGFGFIQPDTSGKQVFIHISDFNNRNRRPEISNSVTYILSSDKKGRPRAINASLEGDKLKIKNDIKVKENPYKLTLAIICAAGFLFTVAITAILGKVSPLILLFYIFISLLTFTIYAIDKSAAQKNSWRTSEKTLHILSVIGGWPGALVAQQKLIHKSRKQSFQLIFWLTVLMNCCIFILLLTDNNTITIQKIFTQISSPNTQKTKPEKSGHIYIYNSKGERIRTIKLEK
jgi:uncharacterized membrane protein YsdA (DUF1294 family)/cold shock CspA family protein